MPGFYINCCCARGLLNVVVILSDHREENLKQLTEKAQSSTNQLKRARNFAFF